MMSRESLKGNTGSRADRLNNVRFALKCTGQADLMKQLSHIVLFIGIRDDI